MNNKVEQTIEKMTNNVLANKSAAQAWEQYFQDLQIPEDEQYTVFEMTMQDRIYQQVGYVRISIIPENSLVTPGVTVFFKHILQVFPFYKESQESLPPTQDFQELSEITCAACREREAAKQLLEIIKLPENATDFQRESYEELYASTIMAQITLKPECEHSGDNYWDDAQKYADYLHSLPISHDTIEALLQEYRNNMRE